MSTETLTKHLYRKAQATLVYDFIVKHADLEYYVDETPARVTVQTEGESHTHAQVPPGYCLPYSPLTKRELK